MEVTQIHISTNSVQELCFLQIFTNACYFIPFGNSHSNRYGAISPVLLICISLKISDAEYLIIYFLTICMSYLGKKCLFHSAVEYILYTLFQYTIFSCLPISEQQTNRKRNKENYSVYNCIKKKKRIKYLRMTLNEVLKDHKNFEDTDKGIFF